MVTQPSVQQLVRPYKSQDLAACQRITGRDDDFTRYTQIEGCGCWVLETAGEIVGLVVVQIWRWNRSAWLIELEVEPSRRGLGYGTALLQQAANFAGENSCRVLFDALPTDYRHLPFYFRRGFRICGYNDLFYDTPERAQRTALLVALELES